MRQILSGWYLDERAWVVAPVVAWMVAYLVLTVVLMIRRRRVMGLTSAARELGVGWRVTFALAVIWLAGWAIYLTVTG